MRKGIIKYSLVAWLAAAAVMVPQLQTWAAEPQFVIWKQGENKNQVDVSVYLSRGEELPGGVSALQLGLELEPLEKDGSLEVTFAFDSQIGGDSAVTVKDYVYDSQEGVLTIFAAGNDITLLKEREVKKLGTVTVNAEHQVRVCAVKAEIAGDGEKRSIELGDQSGNSITLGGSGTSEKPGGNGNDGNGSGGNGSGGSGSGSSGSGGGSSGGSGSGRGSSGSSGYREPSATAAENAGSWEWTGTVWKFKLKSGVYARNTWIYVKGEWYHIDQKGEMNIGWYQASDGTWYYLKDSGAMKKGWKELEGVWYYLREDNGKMSTGWIYWNNDWYYARPSGAMATGWEMVNGKWYYLNPVKPVPVKVLNPETGQMEDSTAGQRNYGAMYAGEKTPDGFQVDDQGARQ